MRWRAAVGAAGNRLSISVRYQDFETAIIAAVSYDWEPALLDRPGHSIYHPP